jgi:putative ABC transport system permease protein
VRSTIRSLDQRLEVGEFVVLSDRLDRDLAPLRTHAATLAAFALFAAVLAAMGVYGVVAYVVTLRRREVAIRIALGATHGQVGRLMARAALTVTGLGLVAGMAVTFAATRLLRSMLYTTSPRDPGVFVGATLVLAITALLAAYIPARRTMRVNPVEALRSE